MRRLFSTFARGAPGVGLLLLRLAAGIALILRAAAALASGLALGAAVPYLLAAGIGVFLLVGLWTPVAGTLAAAMAVWGAICTPADVGFFLLLGALGIALALLGPGMWSIDARLFGWRRVEIRNGKGGDRHPF